MYKIFYVIGAMFFITQAGIASIQIDGVAAYVNNHVITISDVLGASESLQRQLQMGRAGPAANQMYTEILQELIEQKLIADAYKHQKEIQIPSVVVDERVQEVIQSHFQDDRTAFLRALGEEGRSERSWRRDIREQIVVRAMRNLRVDRHVTVSPTEVRAWYEANVDEFFQEGEVTYRMLVVDTPSEDDEDDAVQQVKEELDAGESFADVIQRYSIDRFADRGGLRGPVDPQQVRSEILDRLVELEEEEISEPIVMGGNTIWVQLKGYTAPQEKSLAEAFDEIQMRLFRKRAEEIYDRWIARLRSDAFITVAVEQPF